jgi:hypothetical protein
MGLTTGLAITCGLAAVVSMGAYIISLKRIDRLRALATIGLFCSAMALWQLGLALYYGLGGRSDMNVVYGAAFLLLGAISQVAATFRVRRLSDAREGARDAKRAAEALPATGG